MRNVIGGIVYPISWIKRRAIWTGESAFHIMRKRCKQHLLRCVRLEALQPHLSLQQVLSAMFIMSADPLTRSISQSLQRYSPLIISRSGHEPTADIAAHNPRLLKNAMKNSSIMK